LPTANPDTELVNFAWQYIPCDELAGDFLNFFALDDDHLALYVVDVSGHGVASSLLSVTIGRLMTPSVSASSLLVQQDGADGVRVVPPSEVAYELNQRFPMEEQNELFFTMLYGVLKLSTLEFQFVSAGHDPVVHVPSGGTPRMLEGSNMAIGWVEGIDYDQQTVKLSAGDRLYLYSDGVPEAMDENLNEFSMGQMMEIIELGQTQTLDQSVALLENSVQRWCAKNGPLDDVSILGLEITR
jgi:sigma-B regulation protein RsbU (phosphoserine phosphatase)